MHVYTQRWRNEAGEGKTGKGKIDGEHLCAARAHRERSVRKRADEPEDLVGDFNGLARDAGIERVGKTGVDAGLGLVRTAVDGGEGDMGLECGTTVYR